MTKYFSLLLLVVLIIMPLSVSTTFAWQGPPPGTPPDCDPAVYPGCNPPINVGSASQVKPGGLSVTSFIANATAVIVGGLNLGSLALPDPKVILDIKGAGGTEAKGGIHISGTPRDITWKTGEALQIGEWDGATFLEKMRLFKETGAPFHNIVGIHSANVLEFNYDGSPAKQVDAGKIGYQTWSNGALKALDIVGAGVTGGSPRVVKIWDKLATKELCNEDGTVCDLVTNIINNNGGGGFWSPFKTAIYNNNDGNVIIGTNGTSQLYVFSQLHVGSNPILDTGQVPRVVINNTNTANSFDQGLFVQNAGKGWAIHAKSTNANKNGLRVDGRVMIVDGTQKAGRVLTSNDFGEASWQDPTGGTGGGVGPWTEDVANNRIYTTTANRNVGLDNTGALQIKDTGGTFRSALYYLSDILAIQNNSNGDGGDIKINTKTGAGESMRITSSGKVGIGLTNPAFFLDVSGGINGTTLSGLLLTGQHLNIANSSSGTVKLDIPSKGAGKVLTSDASGNATWQAPSSASLIPGTDKQTIKYDGNNGWVSTSDILIDNLGHIGIGTLPYVSIPSSYPTLSVGGLMRVLGSQFNYGDVYNNRNTFLATDLGNTYVNIGAIVQNYTPPSGVILNVTGKVRIVGDSNAGAGKVLTSDADGVASWQDPTTGAMSSLANFNCPEGQFIKGFSSSGSAICATPSGGSGGGIVGRGVSSYFYRGGSNGGCITQYQAPVVPSYPKCNPNNSVTAPITCVDTDPGIFSTNYQFACPSGYNVLEFSRNAIRENLPLEDYRTGQCISTLSTSRIDVTYVCSPN